MSYLRAPVDTDVQTLIDRALDRVASQLSGWVPREGHLEVVILEEMARMVVETALVAADVPDRIFSAYGRALQDIEQGAGAPATGTLQVTVIADDGWNLPGGTLVAWDVTGDERVFFTTDENLTIEPGVMSGTVGITAEQFGEQGNGLGPGTAVLIDFFAFVDDVTFTVETAGGEDVETDGAYRDRLTEELRLQAPRPILPDDFAVLARRTPGVHRALVLDLYDPSDGSSNNPRMVTLVPVDQDGGPSGSTVVTDLVADMEARREINFVVNTMEPDYTQIVVVFEVQVRDGFAPGEVVDDCEAAIEGWLSPAFWGGGDLSPPRWDLVDTVRYLEAASVLSSVEGVEFVATLTLNGGTADVPLSGDAPLPAPFDASADPSSVSGSST